MKDYSDIILAPVITEKAAQLAADGKTYVFKVSKTANKTQIADAISLRVTHSSPVFFLKKAINAFCTSSRSTLFLIAMMR